MIPVRAKKRLGQHFLNDENIAKKITESITLPCDALLEVGPGTGVLTKYLLELLDNAAGQENVIQLSGQSINAEPHSVSSEQVRSTEPHSVLSEKAINAEPHSELSKHSLNVKSDSELPAQGKSTTPLLKKFIALDVDRESIAYLKENYPDHSELFIEKDFLRIDPKEYFNGSFSVIGNFPYNISSQIFFKVLDHLDQIPEVVCMLQKEVAQRIAAPPGSKTYGILSVLLQAWFHIEYLFTVEPHVFIPPPKVKSAVIRLRRNEVTELGCDVNLFKKVIKTAFNQRRKTLRNALKSLDLNPGAELESLLTKRAEQLSVADFVFITKALQ